MNRSLRQVWDMCGKKRAFKSERAAKQHAAQFPVRIYQCPIWDLWHTTTFKVIG